MGSIVSSRLDFINKNPSAEISYAEMDHELQHLRKRESLSRITSIATLVIAMLSIAGILGGGALFIGALLAVFVCSSVYAHCCRLAESSLCNGQIKWIANHSKEEAVSLKPQTLLGFFSTEPVTASKNLSKA